MSILNYQEAHRVYSGHLFGAQADFVQSDARHSLYVGGRGTGKSISSMAKLYRYLANHPGARFSIIGPTYRRLHDSTLQAWRDVVPPDYYEYQQEREELRTVNGCLGFLRSADQPDSLRGTTLAAIAIDERIPKQAWDNLLGQLRQPGYPHQIWMGTTPGGRDWLWQLFVGRGQRPDWPVYHMSTVEAVRLHRFEPEEYLQSMLESFGHDFIRQEVYGEFLSSSGLIYPDFSSERNVWNNNLKIPKLWPPKERTYKAIVAGVDFGTRAPTAIAIWARDHWGRHYILDEYYERRAREADVIRSALQLGKHYGVSIWFCDSADPGYIRLLRANGLQAVKANKDVALGQARIGGLLRVREDGLAGLILAEKCRYHIQEFLGYANRVDPKSDEYLDSTTGADHLMDADRYAVLGLDRIRQAAVTVVPWSVTRRVEAGSA